MYGYVSGSASKTYTPYFASFAVPVVLPVWRGWVSVLTRICSILCLRRMCLPCILVDMDKKSDVLDIRKLKPGVLVRVGVCEVCGGLYVAERSTKRGHGRCMQKQRRERIIPH